MKLSEWAKQQGVSYKTAWRLWKAGQLPVPAYQLATGTVVIQSPPQNHLKAVLYARVSSADQRADLDRQVARLTVYATANGLMVADVISEIGSGLNGHRKQLMRILCNPEVKVIVVEHRDRLIRFGFGYVEAALAAQGRRIVVADTTEIKDDLVKDLHEVIVSMCTPIYGKRAAKNRADKAMETLK